jgi:DNA-binding transcriptional LysR family regulator
MDRLSSLTAFVHAADTRSFTAAGRQLGISSSAVGKAIARLEERLGVRLFNRSTRSIALTPEGETFLNRCQRIFREIEAAEVELAYTSSAPRGRLRVSLPLVGSTMASAINRFMAAYPEIELDLDFTDRMVDVIEEGFDVVMRTGPALDSSLMTRTLGSFQYCIIGSPAYLQQHQALEVLEDLTTHACLHHRWPATGKLERWPLARDGVEVELELPVRAVASTLEPLISMATEGLGLTCVPVFTVAAQLEAGTLVSVLPDYVSGANTFRALWPSGRQAVPKVRVFVDFMSANLFPKN